jgi:hypothetical protein
VGSYTGKAATGKAPCRARAVASGRGSASREEMKQGDTPEERARGAPRTAENGGAPSVKDMAGRGGVWVGLRRLATATAEGEREWPSCAVKAPWGLETALCSTEEKR